MYTLRDVCRRDSGESYTCARPTGQRGLRTPAFGADTTGEREVPDRHVVRGPDGSPGPRPARPAVNIHSFSAPPYSYAPDMPPASNAQSARQGRSRDDRNRRPHAIGVSLRMFRIACVHVCVRLRGPAVASSGGAGRARGTPSYLVGFARC